MQISTYLHTAYMYCSKLCPWWAVHIHLRDQGSQKVIIYLKSLRWGEVKRGKVQERNAVFSGMLGYNCFQALSVSHRG